MIYFDNAATSHPKPPEVARAVAEAIDSFGNPARGAHPLAMRAARAVESARSLVATLFGCPNPERVAFTKNVTDALNLAIASVQGHIVSSEAEHNSVLRPLYRRGNYTLAPVSDRGCYSASDIAAAMRPDTRAVVVAHASNLTGAVVPLEEIAALCREREALLIVDAAQSGGLLDIDMQALGIDALCFTGHKSLYGPQGTGGLCLGTRFTPEPLAVGGSGSHSFSPVQPDGLPDRLEAGTLNSHGLAGLAAGVAYVTAKGPARLLAGADALAARFLAGLAKLPGVTLYGDYGVERRVPIVAFNLGDFDSNDVADRLAYDHGIAVRAGAHCSPLLHKRFGTVERGALRFSFSHFNTREQVDTALFALEGMVR